jgi:hypothetical protein
MKKYGTLLILSMILCVNLYSQDEKIDNLQFEETPIVEERPNYFAIGAGYVGTFIFSDYTEVNNLLKTNNLNLPEFKNPIYMSGAHGVTGIGIIPNIRVGFFGLSGTANVNSNNDTMLQGSSFSVSLGGFSINYGIVLFKSFAILPGVNLGWSTATLEVYKTPKTFDWTKIDNKDEVNAYNKVAQGSFWFAQPHIDMEYALTPFLMVRANVGYSISFLPSWKYNKEATLDNVPTGINTSGMTLQFGVLVGLFNF